MQHYIPPRNAFAPSELAVLREALDAAWAEIMAQNLVELEKDDALKRALCLKLLSLTRSSPTDPKAICATLLLSLRADPVSARRSVDE
jgi:hypothetical protein